MNDVPKDKNFSKYFPIYLLNNGSFKKNNFSNIILFLNNFFKFSTLNLIIAIAQFIQQQKNKQ